MKLLNTATHATERIDLLNILAGRIALIVHENYTGVQIEQETQKITQIALQILSDRHKDEAWWIANDIISTLPARSSTEIQFLLQLAENTPNQDIRSACASALQQSRPDSPPSWELLEKAAQQSKDATIRQAIETSLTRKK